MAGGKCGGIRNVKAVQQPGSYLSILRHSICNFYTPRKIIYITQDQMVQMHI